MQTIYVGVGEFAGSNQSGDVLKTLALGSCVAVIMRDMENKSVGLLHVALPDSSINTKRMLEKPGMFADSGIPSLLKLMEKMGYSKRGMMQVKLVGGATIMDPNNTFNIGKRNLLAVRKILWSYRMGAIAEDIGGRISRSVSLDVDTGRAIITSPGRGSWEL